MDPVKVEILPASGDHVAAIAELAGVIWRACFPGMISGEQIDYMLARMYRLERLQEEIVCEGIRYNRLFVGGEFVGFASYGPTARAGEFKLHKIYLHPRLQGRGFGGELLRHCEDEIRRRDGRRVTLNVNRNNTRAIAVYRRHGYVIAESTVTDIGGGFVMDDYVMEKGLGGLRVAG